ncbi:hypothetical protein YPC_0806 [Yersinia pestis biovar Medievalis str. Harbin 35]|nr:hypothetical protein YPC_0806 [Yersinia pestis biovar Medievalis str. Harbin 35]EEO75685.1 hypothetical protein YP516_3618 [Yersinia pestis Nepal516]EEO82891.1 hypothetical protein YPF_0867 [Yersinia pestis biovar Orientalis str. India 195]EEO87326.1 hypothetical protein YPH_3265 [Yersinia pestis biovar Orientalis str. PEXU2]EEO91621.1 hypothetical protein YPS_0565 [Yersinia pestis Pestoides A]
MAKNNYKVLFTAQGNRMADITMHLHPLQRSP